VYERLAKLNGIVIPHTAFAKAQGQLERSLLSPGEQNGHIALLGEYCTGKTCLLRNFLSRHPPVEGPLGTKIGVLLVSVPPKATITTVTQRMSTALCESSVGISTMADDAHLVRAMRRARTQLIMLDDCNNLGDSGTERKTRNLCEWLIDLTGQTETRLVVAGPPSCRDLIAQNMRLATRFSAQIILERFSWDDKDQRREFMSILQSFEVELGKHFGMSFIDSSETSFRIYSDSAGLIGNVVRLLRSAVANALAESRTKVSADDFAAARSQFIEPRLKRSRSHDRFDPMLLSPLGSDDKCSRLRPRLSVDRYRVKGPAKS
jgi:hypothetical protein